MSQELSNTNLMLSVTAAWKDGDLQPLFAALDPAVVWKATAPRELFRFGGTYHGVAGVREYTALHASRYHITRFAPKSITAKGDSSHVVHASHHEPAVRVMSLYCEQDFSGMPRMDFPFVRAPRGANPTPLIAQWKVVRKVRDMVNMTQLADYLAGLAGVVAPPFDLQA